MKRDVVYIRVLLVIISIVVLLAFINRSPRNVHKDTWLPSSYNPVGSGNMAFFQTLQELDWPVERWREPLSRLSHYGTGNVLVITRSRIGSRVNFSEEETDLLDDWVAQGNTLLLLGALDAWDDTRQLLWKNSVVLEAKRDSVTSLFAPIIPKNGRSVDALPTAESGLKDDLVLPDDPPFPPTLLPKSTHVLWHQQGQADVIDIPRGAGHIVCVSSADLLSNDWLGKKDNLAIVLHLIAPSGQAPNHLFFEESHHGFTAVYALGRLLAHPGVRFAGMLALLGALAFLGSSLVRFGPVIPLHREAGRSTLEFVDSIADLYLRADQRNETMKYLFTETHQRILHRLNLPTSATHELIATRLQQANPHLPSWKKLAKRFEAHVFMDGLPPTGWLRVAREVREIKSAGAGRLLKVSAGVSQLPDHTAGNAECSMYR